MFKNRELASWIEKQTEVNESVGDLLSSFLDEIADLKMRVKNLEDTHHNKRLLNGKTNNTQANS